MQITKWQPFQSIDDLFNRYARVFNNGFPSLLDEDGKGLIEWSPSANISETKKEFLIKAQLPGVDKSDMHITVDNGALTIKGDHKNQKEEDDEMFHRVECFQGTFSRTFTLPENVDQSKIHAESKDGVLKVHLPKSKQSVTQPTQEIKID
ncbi:MAG: Hsp20/alpha crystallin family protein [Spongiibacteraceae bacterium]